MSETLLLIVLTVFIIGALPAWPYSRTWGFYPAGALGLLLLIVLLLVLMGRGPELRRMFRDDFSNFQKSGSEVTTFCTGGREQC